MPRAAEQLPDIINATGLRRLLQGSRLHVMCRIIADHLRKGPTPGELLVARLRGNNVYARFGDLAKRGIIRGETFEGIDHGPLVVDLPDLIITGCNFRGKSLPLLDISSGADGLSLTNCRFTQIFI
jgi:hypothetical protein